MSISEIVLNQFRTLFCRSEQWNGTKKKNVFVLNEMIGKQFQFQTDLELHPYSFTSCEVSQNHQSYDHL
jgi:hypothetical protein